MTNKEKMTLESLEIALAILPQIQDGCDLWQGEYHEFDVYGHTCEVVRHMKELRGDDPQMIAAAYLHDIGKPATRRIKYEKDGKQHFSFKYHEKVGEEIVRWMNPRLFNFHDLDQEYIARLVGAHFMPLKGLNALKKADSYEEGLDAYYGLIRRFDQKQVSRRDLMDLFTADCLGKGSACTDRRDLDLMRELILGNIDFRSAYEQVERRDMIK